VKFCNLNLTSDVLEFEIILGFFALDQCQCLYAGSYMVKILLQRFFLFALNKLLSKLLNFNLLSWCFFKFFLSIDDVQ